MEGEVAFWSKMPKGAKKQENKRHLAKEWLQQQLTTATHCDKHREKV
jgi:hypothetical protein